MTPILDGARVLLALIVAMEERVVYKVRRAEEVLKRLDILEVLPFSRNI